MTLLQLGTMEGEVFIFDVLATPNREDMFQSGGLKELLEDKNILKVKLCSVKATLSTSILISSFLGKVRLLWT